MSFMRDKQGKKKEKKSNWRLVKQDKFDLIKQLITISVISFSCAHGIDYYLGMEVSYPDLT
jgi:hypothetical protein